MKKLRKIVSLLLAVVMMMSLCIAVSADGDTATLTIKDTTNGASYEVYKILDVTVGTDSQNNKTYAYTVPSEWVNFFTDASIDGVYVDVTEVNGTYYVTWNDSASKDTASMQAFGKLIQKYIDDNTSTVTAAATGTGNGDDLTFSGLSLGYYYVTTSAGSLVVIDTVSENVTIADKNAKPTVEKEVSEDGSTYAGTSYTDISETVYYQVTIEGIDEITVLVLHDDLPSGFSLNSSSVTVTLYSTVGSEAKTVTLVADTDYAVDTDPSCSAANQNGFTTCDFEVDFSKLLAETTSGNYYEYVLSADKPDEAYIVVSYTATITDASTVTYGTATGNVNAVALTTNATAQKEATTTTYTYEFYVYKYDSDDNSTLEGAEFVLKNEDGKYAIFAYDDTNKYYYLTGWDTSEGTVTLTSDSNGLIHIVGLDASTNYYLTETAAPDGYAISTETVTVNIGTNGTISGADTTIVTNQQTIKFANSTSSEMPSTGGIGVTIFYVLGGVIVVAAVVLIVVLKKRTAKVDR